MSSNGATPVCTEEGALVYVGDHHMYRVITALLIACQDTLSEGLWWAIESGVW